VFPDYLSDPSPLVSLHCLGDFVDDLFVRNGCYRGVIEVLVNAMHSGRSSYRCDFNIMDIPKIGRSSRCIAFIKTSITCIGSNLQVSSANNLFSWLCKKNILNFVSQIYKNKDMLSTFFRRCANSSLPSEMVSFDFFLFTLGI